MNKEMAESVAEVLKAAAHPLRLQIIALLEKQELSVGEIMSGLGTSQAVASQQLTLMRSKGVLARRREGTKVYYRIDNPNVIKLLHCMYAHYESSQRKRA